MGMVNISELKEGMVLAYDVLNKHGLPLLKKGVALTEEKIDILKTWGVSEANVEGLDMNKLDQDMMQTIPAEVLKSVELDLDKFFPDFADNAVMEELRRIIKNRKLNQALSKIENGG